MVKPATKPKLRKNGFIVITRLNIFVHLEIYICPKFHGNLTGFL